MLYHFFGSLGKTPDQVTSPEVFGYAHGVASLVTNHPLSPSTRELLASVPSTDSSSG